MSAGIRRLFALLTAAALCCLALTALADGTTTLTTTKVADNVRLSLQIAGAGAVVVNGVSYTSSAEIVLPYGTEPEIRIRAAEGYYPAVITLNGDDALPKLSGGILRVGPLTEDTVLHAAFYARGIPKTGDASHAPGVLLLLSALSLAGLFAMGRRRA